MIVEAKNLVKKFGEIAAVDGVSFSVVDGEIFALLGPNGAGKTTIIKMLTTVLNPTSGELSVAGYDPTREERQARRSFGIVFQDSSVDEELSAYDNMLIHAVLYHLPKEGRKEKIRQLLEFVELWDKRKKAVKYFSGGMKRRLEIAKGLLHHPQILFLDEPTQGLDPQTRSHIWEYIKKMNQEEKMTVFFTTHYIEEVEKMADRVVVVDKGKVIASGTPAELKSRTGKESLEEAFIEFTGRDIRDEEASSLDRMRQRLRR